METQAAHAFEKLQTLDTEIEEKRRTVAALHSQLLKARARCNPGVLLEVKELTKQTAEHWYRLDNIYRIEHKPPPEPKRIKLAGEDHTKSNLIALGQLVLAMAFCYFV